MLDYQLLLVDVVLDQRAGFFLLQGVINNIVELRNNIDSDKVHDDRKWRNFC